MTSDGGRVASDAGPPQLGLSAALGWIAALGATLALARVAPGAAFSIGLGLTVIALLWYVPARPLGNLRLNEAAALLVLLLGLTALSAPSNDSGTCSVLAPGELLRRDRDRESLPASLPDIRSLDPSQPAMQPPGLFASP